MRKQTANSLLNYLKFYQDSVPPDRFKVSMELTVDKSALGSPWRRGSIPLSTHNLDLSEGVDIKPKIERSTKTPGIIPTEKLPEYVAPKDNPDGPDELEKLSWLWCDWVALQKTFNHDMH